MKHLLLVVGIISLFASQVDAQILVPTWGITPQHAEVYPTIGTFACDEGDGLQHEIFNLRLELGATIGNLLTLRLREGMPVRCEGHTGVPSASGATPQGSIDFWIMGLSPNETANPDWISTVAPGIPLGIDPQGWSFGVESVLNIQATPLIIPWPGYGGWFPLPVPFIAWADWKIYFQVVRYELATGNITVSNLLEIWWV
jgi:hypothetical protein